MAVEAGGIGARLRAGREKLGLTVFQAAERLHTDPRIVDALEADDFGILGAPVYARGHIKHYAELVGESVAELNALYVDRSQVAQPDLTKIAKAPPSDGSSKLVLPALVALIVFAVAGAVWWLSALEKQAPRMNETHVVEPVSPPASSASAGEAADSAAQAGVPGAGSAGGAATGAALGASAGSGGATGGAARAGSGASAGAGSGAAGSAAVASAGGKGAVANGGAVAGGAATGRSGAGKGSLGGAGVGAGVAGTAGGSAAGATSGAGTGATGGRLASAGPGPGAPAVGGTTSPANATVTLRYSADSWTEVYDASGQRLFYDVGAANTVQKFNGTYPLRVVLGNASGVAVEFNGRNESIANLLHPDGSAQFSINRSGRVVRARPAADGG